ncbi:MAG TPA: Ig domain-containing protein, partial [Candidatus Nanoarchaeia archaeon]|nr:Ig domain-containing protein [Candidatus Nanoarchaeia archaeon]
KVYVIIQNNAPVLNFIGSKNILQSSLLMFAISGFDYNNDSLTYSASGLPIGATFNPANGVFSWTPTYSQFGDYFVNFSVSDGYSIDSELVKINVIDALFPTYSGLSVNPSSPAIYAPAQTYNFNSVWADNIAVASVWIEFKGINYTVNGTSGVYSFAISDLAAGDYTYRWFASDLSGNTNQTPLTNYTVSKAIPPISISFTPSSAVGSNTQTTATGIGCPAQLICKLYRNGVEVNNSDIASLSDGTYNYVYNTSGNENYTSKSVSSALYVNVASGNGGNNGGKTRVVSDSDLANGYYVYLNVDDKLKFNLCGAPYYITLTDIDTEDDNAYFRLNPGLKSFVLAEEDKEEFDFNLNGVNDIVFRVEKIESNRVKIYIKKLADVCTVQSLAIDATDDVEKLSPDEGKSILPYVIIWLIFGILLAALADLLVLFGKSKRKR